MSNHGKFWWNELVAKDVEASKSFYKDVVGWEYDAMPMPGGSVYARQSTKCGRTLGRNVPNAGRVG